MISTLELYLDLAGKIFAFLISLLIASLPISGFYIWWGRNKKKKNKVSGYNYKR